MPSLLWYFVLHPLAFLCLANFIVTFLFQTFFKYLLPPLSCSRESMLLIKDVVKFFNVSQITLKPLCQKLHSLVWLRVEFLRAKKKLSKKIKSLKPIACRKSAYASFWHWLKIDLILTQSKYFQPQFTQRWNLSILIGWKWPHELTRSIKILKFQRSRVNWGWNICIGSRASLPWTLLSEVLLITLSFLIPKCHSELFSFIG